MTHKNNMKNNEKRKRKMKLHNTIINYTELNDKKTYK